LYYLYGELKLNKMEDFKVRLIKEITELRVKLDKITDFINSDKFDKLDYSQSTLLNIQADAMSMYLKCLTARFKTL